MRKATLSPDHRQCTALSAFPYRSMPDRFSGQYRVGLWRKHSRKNPRLSRYIISRSVIAASVRLRSYSVPIESAALM
jgi:hypothetical protein